MTLKKRIAIYISLMFSLLLGITSIVIYNSFYSFRMEESKDRLEEKALTTIKLLVEVKEIDNQMLALVNRHTINRMFNEKTLIFNDKFELIYSSVDDAVINYDRSALKDLKHKKEVFQIQGVYDVLGMYYDSKNVDYYVLTSVEDKYGNRKLAFLRNLLITGFISMNIIIWAYVFIFVRKLLSPLDDFQRTITEISANQLTKRLSESNSKDEINLMAIAFNNMMKRIEKSYELQREFNANASHELRTPLARLMVQLDNIKSMTDAGPQILDYLDSLENEISMMVEKLNSILLLSNLDSPESLKPKTLQRIDELLFESLDEIILIYPDLQTEFKISESEGEQELSMECNKSLMKIAFSNLIKNAYLYSSDKKLTIELSQPHAGNIIINFVNNGNPIPEKDRDDVFNSYFRGENTQKIAGTGLGLSISQRILKLHKSSISYHYRADFKNAFTVVLNF